MITIFLGLNARWLKMTVTFLMLVPNSWIVYSQPSSTDSTKTFPIEDARQLLFFANRGLILDSLVVAYEGKIETLDALVGKKNEEIILSSKMIDALVKDVDRYKRREIFFKLGLGVLGGALIVFVIL